MEGYVFFDAHVRPLPKKADGTIDTLKPGFQDNDVDTFRHAYVSGLFALEYGEKIALVLGWMNELIFPSVIPDRNMDLWNNAFGRSLAKKHRTKEALAAAVKDALASGALIITPTDPRVYQGVSLLRPTGLRSVVVLKQSESGANELFFDLATSKEMTRAEFAEAILRGQYPGYEIRTINNVEVPVSKRDGLTTDNLS
jgi:hypothetical protein